MILVREVMVPFPLWVNVLLPLLLCGTGALHARALLRRWPDVTPATVLPRARYLYAVVLAPMTAYGVQLWVVQTRQHLMWQLPVWLQYWYVALMWSWVIGLFAHLFTLVVVLAFVSRHGQRTQLAVIAVLAMTAVEIGQYQYTRPIAPRLRDRVSEHGVVLQSDDSSCAPASGANIARRLGVRVTERRVAEVMHATIMGTSPAQVVYGMRALGITCEPFMLQSRTLAETPVPAMLFIDHSAAGHEGHAVAFMGVTDGRAEVWDPLVDRVFLSRDELAERWHGRGFACVREPSSD